MNMKRKRLNLLLLNLTFAVITVIALFSVTARANQTAGTSSDGKTSAVVNHDDTADPNGNVHAEVETVKITDDKGVVETLVPEETDPLKDGDNEIDKKAPGNTNQTPQVKSYEWSSTWFDRNGKKYSVTVSTTCTYTWNPTEGEWDLSWTVTGVKVANIERADLDDEWTLGLNGDGEMDELSVVGSNLQVRLSDGEGGFESPVSYSLPTGPYVVTIGDIDDDEDLDVVVAAEAALAVRVFENDGAGAFTSDDISLSTGEDPKDVALIDLDGDDDYDLIVSSPDVDKLLFFENDGTGDFSSDGSVTVDDHDIAGDNIRYAEVDGESGVDWAVVDGNNDKIKLYDGTALHAELSVGGTILSLTEISLEKNGVTDFVVWDSQNNKIVIALGDDDGTYTVTSHSITNTILSYDIDDLDADGDLDISVGTTGATVELINDGAGVFGTE
jgi:hypothetical protein